MLEEKTIQFANFNITFGENEEAMLMHFEDIVFPAFTGGYIRGKENELPRYSFGDVTIKMIDNEHVLVGNYIKDTEYRVVTTVQEGNLVPSPAEVPTAPYSRFIIFLKNHRMVLVKNESGSPDIRSFQKTVRDILSKYTHAQNRGKAKEEKLPFAIVNIVDIPLKDSIDEVLRNINKINWLKLRFFPLNNDLDPLPIAQAMKNEMAKVGSRTVTDDNHGAAACGDLADLFKVFVLRKAKSGRSKNDAVFQFQTAVIDGAVNRFVHGAVSFLLLFPIRQAAVPFLSQSDSS